MVSGSSLWLGAHNAIPPIIHDQHFLCGENDYYYIQFSQHSDKTKTPAANSIKIVPSLIPAFPYMAAFQHSLAWALGGGGFECTPSPLLALEFRL